MDVVELTPAEARVLLPSLAALLVDVVDAGASVSFMAPLSLAEAGDFWTKVVGRMVKRELVLLAISDDQGVVGTAQLVVAQPPNQVHRADVAKVLVHNRARRLGLGTRLMTSIESVAVREGRSLLVLDTVTGAAGEHLYTSLGYTTVGSIPDYAAGPYGDLVATTVMYKRL